MAWSSTVIPIHAPREGCDGRELADYITKCQFQSTHPARGATASASRPAMIPFSISIHAPREGCDAAPPLPPPCEGDFNPRTPRGVRHFKEVGC